MYRVLGTQYSVPNCRSEAHMNTIFFPLIAIAIPTACFGLAALPLLAHRRVRPTLLGAGGSTCVGFGATIVGLIASGTVQFGSAAQAAADDMTFDSPVCAVSETPPTETANATAERDPAIEAVQETVEIPPGRPKWIGAEPNLRGKVHTIPVASGPYATDPQ